MQLILRCFRLVQVVLWKEAKSSHVFSALHFRVNVSKTKFPEALQKQSQNTVIKRKAP